MRWYLASALAGALCAGTAQAQTTSYSYDALGRLISVTSDGSAASYAFDAAGNRTQVNMVAPDTTPDAFDLGAPAIGAAGAWVSSATPTIAGIAAATPVGVSNAQYRINGGAWSSSAGTILNGQTIQVQVQAPGTPGANQTGTLTIGGLADTFQVTTADPTPDAFDLGVPSTGLPGSWVISSNPTITGINVGSALTVSNAQYRINGGAWTAAPGTIFNGQTVQVQVQASSTPGASQTGTLAIGGVSDDFQVTTTDTTPNAFDLGMPKTGLPGLWVTSNYALISDINAATEVTVSNAQYRINSGGWTTTAGTITNGQLVQVQIQAPATEGASQTGTLIVGGVSDTFQVTTAGTAPDAFDLGAPVIAEGGARVSSGSPTITGIVTPVSVTVSNADYRINGGQWTTSPGTITNGQTVQVQVRASSSEGARTVGTLIVGGVSNTFEVVTADRRPNAFDLGAPVIAAAGGWAASSNPIISGINAATPVTVSNAQYRIDGGAWTVSAGTVTAGQSVQIQVQASTTEGLRSTGRLTIGGVADTFEVTTIDTTPSYVWFVPNAEGAAGAWVTSSSQIISDINSPSPVTVTNGQYRINGGAWTTSPGAIINGQRVEIQVQASMVRGASRTGTLTVGGVSGTFQVTTKPNRRPLLMDDDVRLSPGETADVYVLSNDRDDDGDTLTITAVSVPSNGATVSIMQAGQYLRLTAPSGGGFFSVSYTVSDGYGGSTSSTVFGSPR